MLRVFDNVGLYYVVHVELSAFSEESGMGTSGEEPFSVTMDQIYMAWCPPGDAQHRFTV